MSNRLATAKNRPMTKGLQRISKTAGKRQLQDKSFWIGQIRSKINELNAEIGKMAKKDATARQENESYSIYEKRAEKTSREIAELQDHLAENNLVLEKLSINANLEDILDEIENRMINNQRDQNTLDNIFQDRNKRQQEVMSIAREIDELEALQTDRIKSELSEDDYVKYVSLTNDVKLAREEVEAVQSDCNEVQALVEQLQAEVAADEAKSTAANLYARLSELRAKSHAIEQELLRKEDPLKEQERLGEQIRAGNAATQALERQIDHLDKRIDAASSSYSDLQQQSASLKSGTAAEMKKLLKKQAQLNQMLTEWTQEESQQVAELETTEPQMVNMGEEIRRLKEGIKRLPELGDQNVLDSNIGSNDNAAKLQEEIMKVLVLEKKLDQERDIYHEKKATYKADIQQYSDVQGARNDAEEKRAALNIEREQLQRQRGRFQQAVEAKTRQEQALKSQLQSNTSYMKISDLEKRYKSLAESNLELSESVEQRKVDATPLRNKVIQLERNHQMWLQERLLNGMGVQIE